MWPPSSAPSMDEDVVTLRFLPVDGYAVLDHIVDPKGRLEGLIAVSVVGFILSKEGRVVFLQTARGLEPNVVPLLGPCGEVTMGRDVWASADDYGHWAEQHLA